MFVLFHFHSIDMLFMVPVRVFKHNTEEVDASGVNSVDAEWMAYLGAFRHLRYLNLADCHRINSSALWPITGTLEWTTHITVSLTYSYYSYTLPLHSFIICVVMNDDA